MYFRMYEEYVGNASNTSKTTKTTNTTNTSKTSKTSPHHHYSYITVQYNTRFTSTTEHSPSHPPHADLVNTTAAQPPYHLTTLPSNPSSIVPDQIYHALNSLTYLRFASRLARSLLLYLSIPYTYTAYHISHYNEG